MVFEDKLSDNLSLSVNNEIRISDWSLDETTDRQYDAYKLEVIINQDVFEDSKLTIEIETKITDQAGNELVSSYEFEVDLEEKVVVPVLRTVVSTT